MTPLLLVPVPLHRLTRATQGILVRNLARATELRPCRPEVSVPRTVCLCACLLCQAWLVLLAGHVKRNFLAIRCACTSRPRINFARPAPSTMCVTMARDLWFEREIENLT